MCCLSARPCAVWDTTSIISNDEHEASASPMAARFFSNQLKVCKFVKAPHFTFVARVCRIAVTVSPRGCVGTTWKPSRSARCHLSPLITLTQRTSIRLEAVGKTAEMYRGQSWKSIFRLTSRALCFEKSRRLHDYSSCGFA